MPLNSRVAVPEGGKLAGMRMIVVRDAVRLEHFPERLAIAQLLDDAAGERELPLAERHRARRAPRSASSTGRAPSSCGSRWMKSKMPWPPGSSPVMNVDHATGLCGGIDVPSGANPPVAARRAKFGSRRCHQRSRDARNPDRRSRARSRACRRLSARRLQPIGDTDMAASDGHRDDAARRSDGCTCRIIASLPGAAAVNSAVPSMWRGGSMPNRCSAVGAMSTSAGSGASMRAVAEEHARHQARVDAVIAAPGLDVVLEHRTRHDTGRAVPRDAIARVVADEQVRRVLEVRARVHAAVSNTSRDADVAGVSVRAAR